MKLKNLKMLEMRLMRMCVIVTLILTQYGARGEETRCAPGLDTPGWTVPRGDVPLLYGQQHLEILCMLDQTHEMARGYNASDLVFYRDQNPVEKKYLTVVNSTTLRLHIPHPAMSESMYMCKLQRGPDLVAVCLNLVTVGTVPKPVEKFGCISLNWENLTCTWRAPLNFIKTRYSLTFLLPSRSNRAVIYECPNVTLDTVTGNYSCYWDLLTSPIYRQSYPKYYFNLTASNYFGTDMQDFHFDHYGHVKPSRPVELALVNKTQHSAFLKWEIPYPMINFPVGLIHRVVYRTDVDDDWREVNTSSLLTKAPNHHFNLTGLPYAYRHYNVRVSIRSEKAVGEEMWSDFAHLTFRTSGKPPPRPPDLDVGSFEVNADLVHRNVCIYWKQLEITEENGDNFLYNVEVRVEGIKISATPSHSSKGYMTYRNLPFKSLEFLVSSSNDLGETEPARLIVPAQRKIMVEPSYFTKAALGNGTYELSWTPPKVNSSLLESYTVFWCDNSRDRPFQCEGRLEWERISPRFTSRTYTVPEDKIYQFALSANGYGTSSGMVWASCTIIPNKAIGKIKEIWVIKVESTFVEIGWKLECPDNVGVIKSYDIFYCPIYGLQNTTCKEPIKKINTVKSLPDTRGNITGLKPYTTYAIQVSINATHNVGPKSDPLFSTTLAGPPEPPRLTSITELTNSRMLVSWEPPLVTNGFLVDYKVEHRAAYHDWEEVIVPITEGYLEKLLTNLSSYTNYTVRVRACTVACSEPSEEISVRTAIGRPGPISPPSIKTSRSYHQISWRPPATPGGTVDLYQISVMEMHKRENVTRLYNTTETEILIPEHVCVDSQVMAYHYSVRALNLDSASDHGAAAFTHHERVHVNSRPEGDNNLVIFEGPWSILAESTCTLGPGYISTVYWVGGVIGVVFFIATVVCLKKAWHVIDEMRTIKPIMPDGLRLDTDKESKFQWVPPKHTKEHDKEYEEAPPDEVSLLGGPAPASPVGRGDTSQFSATTTSTSLSGGSSRRAASPAFNPSYSAVGTWLPGDFTSQDNSTPTNTDVPYVTIAPGAPVAPVVECAPGGYVQASMIPISFKSSPEPPVSSLPPAYVTAVPDSITPAASAPPMMDSSVSPYVTIDDPRIALTSFEAAPELKRDKSGYVKHEQMFGPVSVTDGSVPRADTERPPVSKRISAPPLIISKGGEDKRISLNYPGETALDPEMACSPEYCRFGWNSPDQEDIPSLSTLPQFPERLSKGLEGFQLPTEGFQLPKESYELPLEELLGEESPSPAPSPAPHYLPLNMHFKS